MDFIDSMNMIGKTDNNATTYTTTTNPLLDLFFLLPSCRQVNEEDIKNKIKVAYDYDKINTLRIMLYVGSIRNGSGERRAFQICLDYLYENDRNTFYHLISYIPEISRWDLLFKYKDDDNVLDLISYILRLECKEKHLLAKWLPRKDQYDGFKYSLQKFMGINDEIYRKMIVFFSNTIEQQMSSNNWKEIDYSKVPSVSFKKNYKAFKRHDEDRFNNFLQNVKDGKSKINAGVIFPHDIIRLDLKRFLLSLGEIKFDEALELQWKQLPDYLNGNNSKILPICDISGSMTRNDCLPISISIALGIYLSQRIRGSFHNSLVTFSAKPKFIKLDDNDTLTECLEKIICDDNINTNLIAVFKTILDNARRLKLKKEDMPESILIISDMEFDHVSFDGSIASDTNFEKIDEMYKQTIYTRPNIIFWNVNGRPGNIPITVNENGVALIAGASPNIIKSVLSGNINPLEIMFKTINVQWIDEILKDNFS